MVNQFYKAEILTEYVIRGNTAVLKCSIPSFVADFVSVDAWLDDQGNILTIANTDYGNSPRMIYFIGACSGFTVLRDGSWKRVRHTWQ